MQYRRLTAHLQTQNADFDRRLQAYLTNHVAMRTALGQAVSDAWQSNNQGHQGQQGSPGSQFQNGAQFMNPGMIQMPQTSYQQTQMMPPQQTYNRMPSNYRQTPYPMPNQPTQHPNMQNMRSNWQNRSTSIASSPAVFSQQHQSQSQSPIDAVKIEDRRASLPRTPQSGHQHQSATPEHLSPAVSRSGSSANLTHRQTKSVSSPQQGRTPPEQSQQYQRPAQQQ